VPERQELTIYLDSNVLFSASYIANSRFLNFWKLERVTPVTSAYAVDEVRRHIVQSAQLARFDELVGRTRMVSDLDVQVIPAHTRIVAKDQPILAAAIGASVDYLITGDKSHFAHLYGTRIAGVDVLSPTGFLALYEDRLLL
jgi:predicted nucleic acid-binding protein